MLSLKLVLEKTDWERRIPPMGKGVAEKVMGGKPKHEALSDWIRDRILAGTFPIGSRLPSENELAQRFGLSRQTVRQAISTLVRENLLERRQGSGTYVSRAALDNRPVTLNIGVITTYLDSYIFPGVIRGIDRVLSLNGYHMQLGITYNKTRNENQVLSSLLESGVDGLIVEPTKSALPNPNQKLYREIASSRIPLLFLNGYYAGMDFPYVAMNDYESGKMATRYLLRRGHRKIFGIFKSDDVQGHFRYSGYVNQMRDADTAFEDSWVMWYVTEDLDTLFAPKDDERLLSRIGDSTGVICYNDEIACKLLEVFARNHIKVPEQISIVSFDNSDLAGLGHPGLTSIDYPAGEIGAEAARRLLAIIRHQGRGSYSFPPKMVERDSVRNLNRDPQERQK